MSHSQVNRELAFGSAHNNEEPTMKHLRRARRPRRFPRQRSDPVYSVGTQATLRLQSRAKFDWVGLRFRS